MLSRVVGLPQIPQIFDLMSSPGVIATQVQCGTYSELDQERRIGSSQGVRDFGTYVVLKDGREAEWLWRHREEEN